jgi:hypothetical protein
LARRDRLVVGVEGQRHEDRPEDLVLHDLAVLGGTGDQRRAVEAPAPSGIEPPAGDRRAVGHGALHHVGHLLLLSGLIRGPMSVASSPVSPSTTASMTAATPLTNWS